MRKLYIVIANTDEDYCLLDTAQGDVQNISEDNLINLIKCGVKIENFDRMGYTQGDVDDLPDMDEIEEGIDKYFLLAKNAKFGKASYTLASTATYEEKAVSLKQLKKLMEEGKLVNAKIEVKDGTSVVSLIKGELTVRTSDDFIELHKEKENIVAKPAPAAPAKPKQETHWFNEEDGRLDNTEVTRRKPKTISYETYMKSLTETAEASEEEAQSLDTEANLDEPASDDSNIKVTYEEDKRADTVYEDTVYDGEAESYYSEGEVTGTGEVYGEDASADNSITETVVADKTLEEVLEEQPVKESEETQESASVEDEISWERPLENNSNKDVDNAVNTDIMDDIDLSDLEGLEIDLYEEPVKAVEVVEAVETVETVEEGADNSEQETESGLSDLQESAEVEEAQSVESAGLCETSEESESVEEPSVEVVEQSADEPVEDTAESIEQFDSIGEAMESSEETSGETADESDVAAEQTEDTGESVEQSASLSETAESIEHTDSVEQSEAVDETDSVEQSETVDETDSVDEPAEDTVSVEESADSTEQSEPVAEAASTEDTVDSLEQSGTVAEVESTEEPTVDTESAKEPVKGTEQFNSLKDIAKEFMSGTPFASTKKEKPVVETQEETVSQTMTVEASKESVKEVSNDTEFIADREDVEVISHEHEEPVKLEKVEDDSEDTTVREVADDSTDKDSVEEPIIEEAKEPEPVSEPASKAEQADEVYVDSQTVQEGKEPVTTQSQEDKQDTESKADLVKEKADEDNIKIKDTVVESIKKDETDGESITDSGIEFMPVLADFIGSKPVKAENIAVKQEIKVNYELKGKVRKYLTDLRKQDTADILLAIGDTGLTNSELTVIHNMLDGRFSNKIKQSVLLAGLCDGLNTTLDLCGMENMT